jgi:hypothetical protein
MTHTRYRVFDHKNNFHQSYDSALNGAFAWAHACAKRIHGYVMEYNGDEFYGNSNAGRKIIDFTAEKTGKVA